MKKLTRLIESFNVLLLSITTMIMGYQVFGRYLLGKSPYWSEKVILLMMNYFIFLSIPLLLKRDEHISFDYFKERFFGNKKHWLTLFQWVLLLFMGAVMSGYGFVLMKGVWHHKMPTLSISEFWNYLPLFLSGLLIVLYQGKRIAGGQWKS